MKKLPLALLLLCILACNKKNQNYHEGDIYIKLIDFKSLHGYPEDKAIEFENAINSANQNDLSNSELKSYDYFKILSKNNILRSPYFKLKIENDRIINVYTSEEEFSKLSEKLKNLNREKEKIHVAFKGEEIPNLIEDSDGIFNQGIYIASKIVFVKKEKGKTDWSK
ncbi:hypothetical protein [Snuella lapsa]|uniref:Lipoprotein n=1 Tax=Snuella lapsa TaxID=870481 RepID=A0ABP6XPK4_9FLAO